MAKVRLTINIEEEIHKWIQEEANKDLRTTSNYIEFVLYQAMLKSKEDQRT
ncbi:hypothetical protein [[Limnothrix rosea] IAM M-220]|uniref:hypothetical protein n=1 Tax=[Limnothrix rosea] IAM M-220 TaxID=454133 RepID=UPI0015C582B8|nr:hypothetical protein [[Limnothrix rosea] IAM M-220]